MINQIDDRRNYPFSKTVESDTQSLWVDRAAMMFHGPHEDFAMLKAYFDESGLNEPYFVLAGCVAKVKKWRKFERDWVQILNEYAVEELHAKEFFSRDQKGNLVGPYAHLNITEASSFLDSLVQVAQSTAPKIRGGVVNLSDFLSFTEDERMCLTGARWKNRKFFTSGAPTKPYFLPFQYCVVQSCQSTRQPNTVGFVFDRQDEFSKLAIELYNVLKEKDVSPAVRNKMGDLLFASTLEAVALQLADLLAYLVRRRAAGIIKPDQQRILNKLGTSCDYKIFDFNRNSILRGVQFPAGIDRSI